ncbi:MAG: radical SAM protein [Sandaracinaceae bacterium]|nr:radical SAM protein [Sandaracinaceae bacterium]
MQSFKGRFEPTRFEDLTVTVDFHCHSACRFCIVQEGMNRYKGVSFERFRQAVDENGSAPRYRRVTFTGGEVALEKRLFDYLHYAKTHGGFEHIRLQTNGRPFADEAFARRVFEAGVDEYFVSLHGPDAATQDHISQRAGSFDEAWRGLQNLRALGATILTNTVLTTLNVAHLEAIVALVEPLAPARMEFWNYLPMEDKADERGLIVPMAELAPALVRALDRAKAAGIPTAVKYVPMCLLGEHAESVDNTQPDVVIVEEFYDLYPKFACLWEAKCEHAERCLGLTHAYVNKLGWERERLVPIPRVRPWEEPEDGLAFGTDEPGGDSSRAPSEDHPRWRALVDGVAEAHGARLASVLLDRRRCTFRFALGGASVDVVLTKRSDDGPALLRTRSFDVSYRNLRDVDDAAREGLAKLVEAVARSVAARDEGAMLLDERKGLIGEEALRRRRG